MRQLNALRSLHGDSYAVTFGGVDQKNGLPCLPQLYSEQQRVLARRGRDACLLVSYRPLDLLASYTH